MKYVNLHLRIILIVLSLSLTNISLSAENESSFFSDSSENDDQLSRDIYVGCIGLPDKVFWLQFKLFKGDKLTTLKDEIMQRAFRNLVSSDKLHLYAKIKNKIEIKEILTTKELENLAIKKMPKRLKIFYMLVD